MEFPVHVKWREEKFGAVVFDTLNEKVYVTNETGRDILRLLQEGLVPEEIAVRLGQECEAPDGQVREDIGQFVESLRAGGMLADAKGGRS